MTQTQVVVLPFFVCLWSFCISCIALFGFVFLCSLFVIHLCRYFGCLCGLFLSLCGCILSLWLYFSLRADHVSILCGHFAFSLQSFYWTSDKIRCGHFIQIANSVEQFRDQSIPLTKYLLSDAVMRIRRPPMTSANSTAPPLPGR